MAWVLVHSDLQRGAGGVWAERGGGRDSYYLPGFEDLAVRGRDTVTSRDELTWMQLVARVSSLSPYFDHWQRVEMPEQMTLDEILRRVQAMTR